MPNQQGKHKPYVSGRTAEIRVTAEVEEAINRLDEKRRSRLRAIMEKAAEFGPHTLPSEQVRTEGRHSDGNGTDRLVYAFKVWQMRVYACEYSPGGKRTFVCCEVDEAKKKDRADQAKLRRTAAKFCALIA